MAEKDDKAGKGGKGGKSEKADKAPKAEAGGKEGKGGKQAQPAGKGQLDCRPTDRREQVWPAVVGDDHAGDLLGAQCFFAAARQRIEH